MKILFQYEKFVLAFSAAAILLVEAIEIDWKTRAIGIIQGVL